MPSLPALRDGLKANLETIPGLRAHDIVPAQLMPPAAVVTLDTIGFHDDFSGTNIYTFVVRMFVARTNQRVGQNLIDEYLSDGQYSVRQAIESDPTLGGEAFGCTLVQARNYGTVDVGDASYITIDLLVSVGA